MKRTLLIAAAITLLLPGLPMAQQNQSPPPNAGAPAKSGRPGPSPNRPAPPANRPAVPNRPATPGRPGRPNSAPQPNRPARPQPPASRPQPPPQAGRPNRRPPPVARPLPPRGNQFWHRGRYYGRIRGPAFVYPPHWQYRRWSIGARLPALFLTPGYFYAGWAALGLEAPPPGYAWVRFGPDLLEVNLTTGEVEDVVYGVFQ